MLARFSLASLITVIAAGSVAAQTAPTNAEQVKIELRFISVAEDFFERIGVDFNVNLSDDTTKMTPEVKIVGGPGKLPGLDSTDSDKSILLDEKQIYEFMKTLSGDVRSNVVQAPRMIVNNGKKASIRCQCKQKGPANESVTTGYEATLRPTVAKDGKSIALSLNLSLSNLEGDKGSQLVTRSLEEEFTIPTGHSAVVGGWKRVSEGRCEFGPPVLSKIPYVNRLFRNVGYSRSNEHVFVLVTANVVPQEAKKVETANSVAKPQALAVSCCPVQAVACSKYKPANAKMLVMSYEKACAAGRLKEAKELARQALELDPTCFAKP